MPGSSETAGLGAQKVFICYRREETAAHAGRLYDAMVARFGERNVFMDVDIEPGVDFVERITRVVSGCLVLIVVMGRTWATVADENGSPRLADPDDFVRLEVETGLRSSKVTPIPVLVSGARMPRREDLPSELQPLTRRNALDLSDARWGYDVGRLNARLDDLLGETSAVRQTVAEQPPSPDTPAWRMLLEGTLLAGATAFAARAMASLVENPTSDAAEILGVILRRAETWGLVGAVLVLWLAIRTGRGALVRRGFSGLLVGAIGGAIGGATYAVPFYMYDLSELAADRIEIGSLAVTGAFIGALIGAQWRPARLAAGLVSGVVASVFARLLFNAAVEIEPSETVIGLGFGLAGAAIAGLTLATLLALDREEAEAATPAEPVPQAQDAGFRA